MDIKELQDYRLTDAIKFHNHLNPKVWGSDEHVLPEVREKLLAIAEDFKEFLGLDLEVKDITLSGSNAAYTYTDHSDLDLHLVVDLPKADASEVYRELFDAKKYQYNDIHNYTIGGIPVELYVQNANEEPKSQGIYSLAHDKWLAVPKRRKPEVDDISVKSKYEDIGRRVEDAINSQDPDRLEAIAHKIRAMRQAGLDKTGEFGPENLAFKILRSNGTLDQLRAARSAAKSAALSIDEEKNKKRKTNPNSLFGGLWFPGYHYYGASATVNDDAITPDDIGADEVKESTDNIESELNRFAAYCVKRLGIKNAPRIRLKRDPAWSERNATFGKYDPNTNTLTLTTANRHPVDVMRTLAHEFVHRKQAETGDMPADAGDTGSEWENEANAEAGVIMRDWGAKNPELFDKKSISESSGYIPVTDAEAKDPRYSMAITVDIKPGEVKRQAAKMGWKTTAAGTPPTARTNGLVESLQRKLDQVKAETLTEQQLDEVNMSPGALQSWAKDHAAGMKSGFEAELIFKDLLKDAEEGEADDDMEPDYDQDEQADDIDDVLQFFSSEMTTRQRRDLSDEMYTTYREWYDEAVLEAFEERDRMLVKEYLEENNKWDWQEKIAEYLQDTLGKTPDETEELFAQGEENEDYAFAQREVEDQFDKLIDLAVSEGFDNDDYQAAYDEFADDFDGRSERDWLRSQGIRNMSDVSNEYSIDWPHWRPVGRDNDDFADGGYHSSYAEMLANRLKETLGVKTQVESGTRGASAKSRTPSDVWVFEADGSLTADARVDMPVEIVSPPMPLEQTLEIMPKFFEWATSQGAYANKSTGLHMSVSMPEHAGDNLDYAKAALFLGDQYVLEQFGRTAQSYCSSALKEIKKRIDQRRKNLIPADNEVTKAFNQMRAKLNSLATKAFAQPGGYGKYYSINPKEKYIEFRSAGGKDYIKDVPKLQNTMLRYARAMSIGMDPAAEKAEYAKKLYKLLGNVELQQNPADTTFGPTNKKTSGSVSAKSDKKDAIWYFTRYAAGELTESDLKKFVKQMQGEREAIKRVRSADKMWWKVYQAAYGPSDGPQIEVVARNPTEAVAVARKEWGITSATHRGFTDNDFVAEPLRMLTPAEIEQTRAQFEPQAPGTPAGDRFAYDTNSDPNGNYVIRRRDRMGNDGTGPVIYRFTASGVNDALDQTERWKAARGLNRLDVWLSHVDNVPPEILAANGFDTEWEVWNINDPTFTVIATGQTADDAITDATWNPANDMWTRGSNNPAEFRARRVPTVANPPAAPGTSRSGMIQPGLVPPGMPPNTPDGNWSLRNRNNSLDFGGADGIGPILYQFQAGSNSQAIDTSRQYARALEIPRERLWLSMTNEVPAEYRTQRAHLGDRIPPARTAIGQPNSDTGYWVVFSGTSYNNVAIIAATTPQQGQAAYQQWVNSDWRPEDTYHIRPATPEDLILAARNNITVPPRNAALSTDSQIQDIEPNVAQNFQQPARPTGNTFTGQWSVISSNTGEEVYRFGDIGNAQSDANRVAAVWAHRTGFDDPIEVYPVMQ